jgi:predicted DCC family thiol-disulfide oxidoreductase YuxK
MAERAGHDGPIVLFDGVCNLCNGAVQFLIERDPQGVITFAPLQSAVAADLLATCDRPTEGLDSIVLVEDGQCYRKSTAVLRVARHLAGPARWLWPLRWVPRLLRDAVYDLVARSRYHIFGRRDACMRPTPAVADRFLTGPTADDSPETG